MDNLLHNITLSEFKSYFSGARSVGMGDDFFIMDISLSEEHRMLTYPFRLDCFMVIYCLSGHLKLNVNLASHELKSGMIFLHYPGNILRINELVGAENEEPKYVCVMMSRSFVGNLMLDVNRIFARNPSFIEQPSLELEEEHRLLLRDHVRLMVKIIQQETRFRMECIRSVLSSIFYFLAGVWGEKLADRNGAAEASSGRSRTLVDQFIKLVSEYHTSQRNVGFYAEKLCLTPKYLSRVIRDATGKSAPEWIDTYVILEAKNLLKYSGLAIKEIVYKLNFPNQSVFYKFFKARTGMTPSEYRNS